MGLSVVFVSGVRRSGKSALIQTMADRLFDRPFSGVTRPASASPATGSGSSHKLEQTELIQEAFGA